jgi:NTE family protein
MGNAPPRIGLALSAGSARGLAHIGVLKVLDEEQIPVHFIAGTSIGGLVGALYASGADMNLLGKLCATYDHKNLWDLTVPRWGLIAGKRIEELLTLMTKKKTFADLDLPLAVVATDLELGQKVVLREGPIADAIRASISIPGIFHPVRIDGRVLVDGAVVERLPVSVAREMGADIVLSSDVGYSRRESKINSIFDVILQCIDILDRQASEKAGDTSDLVIRPAVEHIAANRFDLAEECICCGEEAARQALPELRRLLAGRP